ncbi:response regulator [Cohnella sp. REN36]|uniref:response regulator n=1 Tax=Cohnella sp. REN36 TaxID=2887347 RepID=UPI001D139804|nr:response regulator [Cohnella sp. REN36]MCC3376730.1 response regulator [Cohnella sp. REN36]
MVQLLIVDDEIHVVEGLLGAIDWRSLGIEQVYRAHAGPEAIALLEQCSIDIVLTDIRMPGMSGLQLVAEVRRRWPRTKCILLSGHSEFRYAREAILYQTEDYLLKPVRDKDLTAAVRRAADKLREEWEEVVSRQRLSYTLKEHLPLLRANLLNDLLQGRQRTTWALREKMGMLGFDGEIGDAFELMMIRLDDFPNDDANSRALMEYAVGNMVEELFGERYRVWHTRDALDYLVFVMLDQPGEAPPFEPAWFERTAASLQSAVHAYLKGSVSVLVGGRGRFPEELRERYDRAVSSFRRRIGSVEELFARLDEPPEADAAVQTLHSLYEPPTLTHLLEAARWESLEEKLEAVFEEMERRFADSPEHLQEVYYALAAAFAYIAHKNGRPLRLLIGEEYERMSKGLPLRTVKDMRNWAFRCLKGIREDMDRETKDSRTALIDEIRAFVEQRLFQDVSLQSISEHVYLHPVYVSKIYKLVTGENLSDYIQNARMDKAQFLLRSGSDKVYEIASKLGYLRPHSFNHAFKRKFGMTPQEYRDRHT